MLDGDDLARALLAMAALGEEVRLDDEPPLLGQLRVVGIDAGEAIATAHEWVSDDPEGGDDPNSLAHALLEGLAAGAWLMTHRGGDES